MIKDVIQAERSYWGGERPRKAGSPDKFPIQCERGPERASWEEMIDP